MAKNTKQLTGQLNRFIRRKAQSAARHAAAEIMNDLAEKGPNWSGRFKNSWVADAPGTAVGKKANYPYKVSDVAKLKDTIAAVKQDTKLVIYNYSPYALYALDLKEGKFIPRGAPKGPVIEEGKRRTNADGLGIRGDVSGDGNNRSTAPLDWFMTYIDGGGLQKALANGVKIGFRREA
jgi:hypothetical protein